MIPSSPFSYPSTVPYLKQQDKSMAISLLSEPDI